MLLAMPRSDEVRTAIPQQVARQRCLLLLRRPHAMLNRQIVDVKQACLEPLPKGKTMLSWPNLYGRFCGDHWIRMSWFTIRTQKKP
jgi:hypothetical protein